VEEKTTYGRRTDSRSKTGSPLRCVSRQTAYAVASKHPSGDRRERAERERRKERCMPSRGDYWRATGRHAMNDEVCVGLSGLLKLKIESLVAGG